MDTLTKSYEMLKELIQNDSLVYLTACVCKESDDEELIDAFALCSDSDTPVHIFKIKIEEGNMPLSIKYVEHDSLYSYELRHHILCIPMMLVKAQAWTLETKSKIILNWIKQSFNLYDKG